MSEMEKPPSTLLPLCSRATLGLALFLFVLAGILAPAVRAQEIQVPLDEAGRIERLDAGLARQLGMFVEQYPGFEEARLFQSADSTYVLEVSYRHAGRLVRERQAQSAAEVASLRRLVTQRIALKAPEAGIERQGRPLLLGGMLLLGLGFYDWAVPVSVDATGKGAAALAMLAAAGSYFIPAEATRARPVSYAMADMSLYGATRGILHGVLLHRLLAGDHPEERGTVQGALAASLLEGTAGYLWAQKAGMNTGVTHTLATGGDFGMLWAWGFADLLDLTHKDKDEKNVAAIALAGGGLGLAGGRLLANRRDYTWGDAEVMRLAGLLAAGTSASIVGAAATDEDKPLTAVAILSSVVGLGAGDRLVSGKKFSSGSAILVDLGTIAGSFLGLGIAFLATPEHKENGTAFAIAGSLGGVAGFGLTYRSLSEHADAPRQSSLRLELAPQAWLQLAARRGRGAPATRPVPFVKLIHSF